MADTVQYRLERMVDELDDLERRGFFTHQEIAEIVKQRRKFEYRLKRPSPLKQDYLAYIEYETQLDTLRRLRKKSVARDLKEKGNKKMKMSVSDFAGVSRIVDIYRLAVTRYKGDIDLWFRYLEFCRARRNGRMKKVLAQLIRFHPKVPGVWIYAAAWEFDHNLNVAAARALMQSGLRVCPNSEDLWIEYLRMELTYLNKLKARKVALGEDTGTLLRDHRDADEQHWRDENNGMFMSLDEERGNNNGINVSVEDKADLFREQGLNILQTIYSGAIEALPSSFGLRKRLFEIFEATELAHSEDMRNQLLNDMKRDFSSDSEYWDWLARLELTDSISMQEMTEGSMPPQLQKAVQVYEEALQFVSSPTMFSLYAKFLMDVIAPKREDNQLSGPASHTKHQLSHLLTIFKKAEISGCISEDFACEYVSFYLQLGRLDEARKLAENFCSGKLSDSVKLLLLRASIEIRIFTNNIPRPSDIDLQSIFGLLKNALTKVSISQAEELWVMAIKLFAVEKHYFEQLVEMSFISVAKDGGGDHGFSLPSAIVNCVLQKNGIQFARETYKRFLALPRPGLALLRTCIELEENLASIHDKECLGNARKLYESALATHDQNVRLWRDYHAMEIKLGTSETANAVYWRARKTLKNSASLITSPDFL
ncbi:U3 small nucleolar RNA-associated protein 6 homolog [Ricinus communis]|uniref:Hepatocellular carcinoma-associated antigen, putative n=1 Tax=Ricinus communis TaxID=3988 RepID=B9RXI9_RICCO|nr:U3 small nucleolar RNA-associated protein 6 homolog [Ricinus communis]EEF43845.1 hepatocellular carcinoma-associated antigen, putative [Ricinus communis]|eukprot:XP_002518458.1 U3 small nucleolar RNA-associated protein 6 homolog [Ricinus communis]